MTFVLEGIVAIGLVISAIWALFFRTSIDADRAQAIERAREAKELAARKKADARLYRKNEPLRCLSCGAAFKGPLTDYGCPECHLVGLVVTESDYRKTSDDQPSTQTLGKDN